MIGASILPPPAVLAWWVFAQQVAASASGVERWATLVQNAVEWSHNPSARLLLSILTGGVGLWMMLPGASRVGKTIGGLGALVSVLLMFSLMPAMGIQLETIVFWMLSGITLSAGVATITSRSPVYCAIWFAVVLLGTGGLFLVNGEKFLGVATVAVYAGAIVVTFLFVLMLAQPEGHAFYDRVSWGKIPSLLGCLAGVAVAALIVGAVAETPLAELAMEAPRNAQQDVLVDEHVAALGGKLFTKHLINVQLAATLLLAALVGVVAMAAQGSSRPEEQPGDEVPSTSPTAMNKGATS